MKDRPRLFYLPVTRKLMAVTGAYLAGVWLGGVFALPLALSGALCAFLLLACGLCLRRGRNAFFLWLLLFAIAGNLACGHQLSIRDEATAPGVTISGTVKRIEGDFRVMLECVALPDGKTTHRPVVVTLMRQEDEAPPDMPKVGQRITGTGRLFAQDEARNPGGMDGRLRALVDGYELSGYLLPGWQAEGDERFSLTEVFRQLRATLFERLNDRFDGQAALFAAVMLGERQEIDAEMTAAMRMTGTAHILSVSGMHLSMVAAALSAFLGILPIGRRVSRCILSLALLLFTGLTGCAVGTIRALVMTLLRLYARAHGRRYDPLTALAFAALGITAVQPLYAFDGGFQFSFFVVLGIILLQKPLSTLPPIRFLLRRAKPFGELLLISLSAQIASLPMQLSLYGYVPLLSLPMNLFCAMAMPLIMIGGWCVLLLDCVIPEMAAMGASALSLGASAFEAISLYAANLDGGILRLPAPHRSLLIVFAFAMMLISRVIRFGKLKRPVFAAVLVLMAALYLPRFDSTARYVQLDVGQGDAALIRTGRKAVVIDVGPADSYDLIRYLRHEGLFVDAVVLSHLDEDHAGALSSLLASEIEVPRVVMAKGAQEEISSADVQSGMERLRASQAEVRLVEAGDSFSAADTQMIVLSPDETLAGSNERSLLLYSLAGGRALLLTGDLPSGCEPDVVPECDVLKVAHHGSKNATSDAFLEMVRPEIALISAGKNNSYGHPHVRVLDALETIGARVERTDQSGCITVRLEEDPMEIKTFLGSGL